MKDEIDLTLLTFSEGKKSKRGIIKSLITGFIKLVYKGISSFLHQKRHKALHRVVNAMNANINLEKNSVPLGGLHGYVCVYITLILQSN